MEKYKGYEREIRYYETDKMAVVHHSNYARLLEESRIDMMRYYGLPYEELEACGYMIPVLELSSKFVKSLKFADRIVIMPKIDKINGFRFFVSYVIYDETRTEIVHTATSTHCFLDRNFRPVSLKREAPELFEKLKNMMDSQYEE